MRRGLNAGRNIKLWWNSLRIQNEHKARTELTIKNPNSGGNTNGSGMAFFIAPGPSPYFELVTRFNNKQKLYGRVKAKVTIGRDKDLEKMENQVPAWMGTTGWRLFFVFKHIA
jgi:hypothetical protein